MASPNEMRFAGLLGDELAALRTTGHVRHFPAGTTIFSAGDPGDGFHVVESGRVQISAALGSGELRPLATIGPGECFGEMALLDDAPRSAAAIAEIPTQTLFLNRADFLSLLQARPTLALNLIREFSGRMRALNGKYLTEIVQSERLATVGRFASTIVHDFKNPLATIGLAAELAAAPDTPAALRTRAQHQIERQIARMSTMLNELIDFTRPSDRRTFLTPTNFGPFITPILAELREEVANRDVALELLTPAPAVEIQLQPSRLPRLFYNLIANAVDAMPHGGKIFLGFHPAGRELRVELEDTGPGIAPEIAQQLFQPFATHGKSHGTGLGLSIAKRIAEDHGGRLWVESAPGRGAKFCFTLPVSSPPA